MTLCKDLIVGEYYIHDDPQWHDHYMWKVISNNLDDSGSYELVTHTITSDGYVLETPYDHHEEYQVYEPNQEFQVTKMSKLHKVTLGLEDV